MVGAAAIVMGVHPAALRGMRLWRKVLGVRNEKNDNRPICAVHACFYSARNRFQYCTGDLTC